jgi:heme/copper-type cytochrome/quinol oxidase subunit 2
VAIGLSISVTALVVAAGGSKMSSQDLSSLQASAIGLLHVVYILLGIAAGAFVIWVIHLVIVSIQEQRRRNNPEDTGTTEITISSTKLEAITKEIESYKKAKTELEKFLNKVQEKTPNSEGK